MKKSFFIHILILIIVLAGCSATAPETTPTPETLVDNVKKEKDDTMKYTGKWIFHSVGVMGENGELTYMSADEYINSPMMYIDETDEEAVADEIKERKQLTGSCVEVCEDGKLYVLMPVPEDITQEMIDEAVDAGEIIMRGDMFCERPMAWEERDGKLWFDTGIEGEAYGETADTWACATDEEGFFTFMTTRYVKEDK